MNKFLKGKKAQKAQNWIFFTRLVRQVDAMSNHKSVRGIFKRALNTVKEEKLQVAQEWLDWEKKFGGLDQAEEATKFLKKLNIYEKLLKADLPVSIGERPN